MNLHSLYIHTSLKYSKNAIEVKFKSLANDGAAALTASLSHSEVA